MQSGITREDQGTFENKKTKAARTRYLTRDIQVQQYL